MNGRDYAATSTTLRVERWDAEQTRRAARAGRLSRASFAGLKPYLTTRDVNCNMLVQGGWAALLGGIAGTPITTLFGAANGRIGIGTATTAPAWTDTYLTADTGSASTTSWYQLVDSAPVVVTSSSPATLELTATFGPDDANFAWNEFGADNGSASGACLNGLPGGYVLINHGTSAQGTKTSGETWVATATIYCGVAAGDGTVA